MRMQIDRNQKMETCKIGNGTYTHKMGKVKYLKLHGSMSKAQIKTFDGLRIGCWSTADVEHMFYVNTIFTSSYKL